MAPSWLNPHGFIKRDMWTKDAWVPAALPGSPCDPSCVCGLPTITLVRCQIVGPPDLYVNFQNRATGRLCLHMFAFLKYFSCSSERLMMTIADQRSPGLSWLQAKRTLK